LTNTQNITKKPIELQPHHVLKLWRHRPKIFMQDVLDITPLAWQEDCLQLYMENPRLAMVASKGVGKTLFLASVVWHFFMTGHLPKIAVLSITKDHLKSNLWAELIRLRSRSELLQRSSTDGAERIALLGHEQYSFIDARSFPKSADENQQASALAGLHADHVMFAIDEAGTIPDAVIQTADAALSTGDSDKKRARLVVASNPEEPKGVIYRAVMGRSKQKWATYNITGDPEDPKRSPLVAKEWAQDLIDQYGKDDPWVMVNVYGKYPSVSSTQLITEQEVHDAMNRSVPEEQLKNHQMRLGIDVARGGVDSTCLSKRRGLMAYPIEQISSGIMGPEIAGKVAFMVEDDRIERIFVDNTGGFGGSVVDSLALFPNLDVTPVHYSSKAQDKRYYNKRTEMWARMRDWIKRGGCLPKDPRLAEEILMPKLIFHGGVFRLEEKEQIKSRIGRSPDKADALAQTFADVEQPSFFADFSNPSNKPFDVLAYYRNGKESQQKNYYSDESDVDKRYRPSPNYKA
jgi:hypothetical protein